MTRRIPGLVSLILLAIGGLGLVFAIIAAFKGLSCARALEISAALLGAVYATLSAIISVYFPDPDDTKKP